MISNVILSSYLFWCIVYDMELRYVSNKKENLIERLLFHSESASSNMEHTYH